MEFLNQWSGMFLNENMTWYVLGTVVAVLACGYLGVTLWLWSALALVALVGFGAPVWSLGLVVGLTVLFAVPPIRAALLSKTVMTIMKKLNAIPQISQTERTALEAGVVWIEKDLFSGSPKFSNIMKESYPELTSEEKAFLDNQVETLCSMCNDWDIYSKKRIPKKVWDYLKKEKFFGMIIPKEYGGLGFTALAHSEVIMKINSRCGPVAVTTMVPNSLGPAELLVHYGTEKQRQHYLPRLADGRDIPCFALTEPEAGSDAGSLTSHGVVFKGDDGKLYVRLNWNKRWITLAAISSVLGLAFRLRDPEGLLGKGEDVGITCALIPSNTPGVVIGRRHDPMGVPFYNCPTQGKDVVVAIEDAVVGGVGGCGNGWTMLMESLGAGRGVSLPSQSAGGAKLAVRAVSAHATVRKQFGLSIGKFEGVEEPLARIGSGAYMLEALRKFTVGALDKGIKPPVVTAIAKYNATETGRMIVNDAMDVFGGAGISRGNKNLIYSQYVMTPIGITVEGANILTRTLMIFGQGALRAHPYAFKEVNAVEKGDVAAFDQAFWGHMAHIVKNLFRATLLFATRGHLASSHGDSHTKRYFRKLVWVSATFAILADVAMGVLQGKLKAKEKITGRFADILSHMYLSTAVLRRYEAEGCQKEDLPLVHYWLQHSFNVMHTAFDGIFGNMPGSVGFVLRAIVRPLWNINGVSEPISDDLGQEVAQAMLTDGATRDRLTVGMYIPKDQNEHLAKLDYAFKIAKASEAAERKVRKAIRKKQLPKKKVRDVIEEALQKNFIDKHEFDALQKSSQLSREVIQVDDFSEEEYLGHSPAELGEDGMSMGLVKKSS
ncbi:MAG: acyl-CoA dehydrogenase [Bdellovibrionales bacterium]|nr:acyl-CoA dehydrogenase [Bdellovibrionales bacterium]